MHRRAALGTAAAVLAAVVAGAMVHFAQRSGDERGEQPGRLTVTLHGPSGKPAAGAALALQAGEHSAKARSDARGRAVLALPSTTGVGELEVRAKGAASVHRTVRWREGRSQQLTLALSPEAKISGRVLDETGAAISGAAVEAVGSVPQARAQGGAKDIVLAAAVSDAEGRFTLGGLSAGQYAVQARAELHEEAVLPQVQAPSDRSLPVVLERTSALRGEVLGPDGKPVAGATVTAGGSGLWPPRSFDTDGQGRFALSPLPAGVYEVRARRGGDVSPPREGLLLEPAAESFVSLSLAPGAVLRGQVLDAGSGRPLAGAEVLVVEDALSAAPLRARSDAQGRFEVGGLRPLVHRVWVRADGYVALVGRALQPADKLQVLGLYRAGRVAGRVIDEGGKPVSGAEVELVGTTLDGAPLRLSGPVPTLGVSFSPPPAGDSLGITQGPVPKVPLEGPLLPGLLAQASAREARDGAGGLKDGVVEDSAFRTDEAGRFELTGVAPGKLQVSIHHPGYAPGWSASVSLAPGGALRDVEVVLGRGVDLGGRVLDARGFPVSGIRVELAVRGEPSARVTLSGRDGGFSFDTVRGAAVLSAHPAGAPEVRQSLELQGSGAQQVVLKLGGEARTLAGRVVDARGFPLEGSVVRVDSRDPRSPVSLTAVTGRDGTFEVSGLPAPPWRVEAQQPGFAPTIIRSVSLQIQRSFEVTLLRGAHVVGRVLDHQRREPVAGASVRLLPEHGHGPGETHTDAQGQFAFENLPSGPYTLSVRHPGHVPASSQLKLQAGRDAELEALELEAAGAVSGDVVDRLGVPVAGAQVTVGDPPDWSQAARTDARGHFRLASVEPGAQDLSARHPSAGEIVRAVAVRVYPQQESPALVLRLPDVVAAE